MDIPAKLADLEGQMVFAKNIMDKQDDDHRHFAERVNENHNTMNANIQILKEDMAHTKETVDTVNNTLQALLRQRHHSRSSRSSRTRSSRPRGRSSSPSTSASCAPCGCTRCSRSTPTRTRPRRITR